MHEAVTDILIDRSRQAEGLGRTLGLSLAAHAVLIALVVWLPAFRSASTPSNENSMVISLGGAPGPRQGMTPMASRAIQKVAPMPKRPEPIPPPPARTPPEMVEPVKTTPPRPKPVEKPQKEVERAPARKPTTGAEVKSGAARVETGGQAIPFGGLATGGGGTGGYLDVKDFCCPDYLQTMVQVIQRNWQSQQNQPGQVIVKFTIQRDGTLTGVEVEKPANYFQNMAAQRAVLETRRLPPLPAAFPEDHLTVHLIFQYQS
jgi:TonB family protein